METTVSIESTRDAASDPRIGSGNASARLDDGVEHERVPCVPNTQADDTFGEQQQRHQRTANEARENRADRLQHTAVEQANDEQPAQRKALVAEVWG